MAALESPSPVEPRTRLLLLSGLWLFLLVMAIVFRSVVVPFAGAALIAYLIAPVVNRLGALQVRGHRFPHWLAILVIYALFFFFVYLFLVALLPQIYGELVRIAKTALAFARSMTPERIEEIALATEHWFMDRGVAVALAQRSLGVEETAIQLDLQQLVEHTVARIGATLEANLGDIVGVTRLAITRVVAGVFMLFMLLMVAAFFSIDARNIRRYAVSLLPPESIDEIAILVRRIDRSLSGVVRGQITICLVNGVLTFIGLLIFKVKFAFLLAFVATFLSLIPIFGTILSSVPIVLIGLSQSFGTGVAILLWIIGIHAVEAYLLNPKIMGSAARIHPVVVAFSLVAGQSAFGLLGALFAVPVASVVVACFDFLRMKANSGLPPRERLVQPSLPAQASDPAH